MMDPFIQRLTLALETALAFATGFAAVALVVVSVAGAIQ